MVFPHLALKVLAVAISKKVTLYMFGRVSILIFLVYKSMYLKRGLVSHCSVKNVCYACEMHHVDLL